MYRVLIITDIASNFGGNAVETLKAIKSKLGNNEAFFAFPKEAKGKAWVEAFSNPIFFDFSFSGLKGLKKIARENKIDLIYYNYVSVRTSLNFRFVFKNEFKILYHFRCNLKLFNSYKKFLVKYLYRLIYKSKKFYKIAISDAVMSTIEFFDNKNNIKIVDGISLDRLESKENQNIFSDDKIIECILFGNHYKIKGLDMALKAIIDANKLSIDKVYRLNIITSREYEVENYIKQTIDGGVLSNYYRILPNTDEIYKYYDMADVLISASKEEGLNNSIIEAIYKGLSVVATNIPGQNEIVLKGIKWVENPNTDKEKTIKEITNELLKLNKKETNRAGKENLRLIDEYYSLEACSRQIVNTFEYIIGNKNE